MRFNRRQPRKLPQLCRRLAQEEGIFAGTSSGLTSWLRCVSLRVSGPLRR